MGSTLHVAEADDRDALWILQHHQSPSHSEWWRSGVSAGLASAVCGVSQPLASAVWRWLELKPQALRWLERYFDATTLTELWLASDAPELPAGPLLNEVKHVCSANNWPSLLATVLRGNRPLTEVVTILRSGTATPEAGLEAALSERSVSEVVDAAATTAWPPLLNRAADATRAQPHLFAGIDDKPAVFELLRLHLALGGQFPEELINVGFLSALFDKLLDGDDTATVIATKLPARAGGVALAHSHAAAVLARLDTDVQTGAAEAWWACFTTDEDAAEPPAPIRRIVIDSVRDRIRGASIILVVRLLEVLPSIDEPLFIEWMRHTEFFWEEGDHQRMARVLEARQWKSAATTFRRSWKQELKLVAWHAKSLLSWSDRFWWPPSDAGERSSAGPLSATHNHASSAMRITFLAANPLGSGRLALDEEARAIEEKVRASKHRDLVEFRTRWAVRPDDLQQALLEDEPVVVHFSGHGGAVGIILHSQDQNAENLVAEGALVDLFRVLKNEIRVVVLNACYSEVQAQAIVREIDFVVGMSESVADDAARVFAAAFYRGLAFGRSVQDAFDLGSNALRLEGLSGEDDIPKLLVRSGMDASSTRLVGESLP